MSLPEKIAELVARFREHEQAYLSAAYNETLLRDDFLDVFFGALGWDLNNSAGYAEAYRDVVKEEALRTGDGVKAPDFTFRIGGVRKFFVEAKRPSIHIASAAGPAYQLRRYAWSAKLPLSILTNFRELAVYDTRVRPERGDKASVARVFLCKYEQLEEKWAWLSTIFSKEAILRGSFDKYVDDNRAKRGTSEVDADFLLTIERWRVELATDLAKKNSALSAAELNFAVTRLIDRIIFLRIGEDRGVEPYGQLANATRKAGVYSALSNIFVAADAKYNSGIFHFRDERGRSEPPDRLTLTLKVDDRVLREIITSLYYPASPYEFSVLSADILGQVYEQFLGQVISLTPAHQAVIEEKPEVRRAGGVYYTPQYIVEHMVRATLGSLTSGKSPKQIAKLRVLDPACGSGSFLITAYQHLLDWYQHYYVSNDPAQWQRGRRARLVETASGLRLTLDERRRVLLTHIFGVDIDSQAVEVTKLSLLLKVLEGETEQTIQPFLSVFQERALPDLDKNIKCGNSLIGSDFYDEHDPDDEPDLVAKVNAFDWASESGFADIMTDGGFDVVIGNPPYIFVRELLTGAETAYFSARFELAWDKHNTYMLFMQLLLRLLNAKGLGAMIVPNSWLTIESGKLLRVEYVGRLREVDALNYEVFKGVAMEPCIFVTAGKPEKEDPKVLSAETRTEFVQAIPTPVKRETWQSNQYRIVVASSHASSSSLDGVRARAGRLGAHFDVRTGLQAYERGKGTPPQTQADVDGHIFDARSKVDDTTYPYLQGRDVDRFGLKWSRGWMRYGAWLSQPRELAMFTRPRVLLREITGGPPYSLFCAFTDEIYLSNKSVLTILHAEDDVHQLKALCAVMNSSLMTCFYRHYGVKGDRRLFPKVVIRNLREFPYPELPDASCIGTLAQLHDKLSNARRSLARATVPRDAEMAKRQMAAFQAQADATVFELFGVSSDERVGITSIISGDDKPVVGE